MKTESQWFEIRIFDDPRKGHDRWRIINPCSLIAAEWWRWSGEKYAEEEEIWLENRKKLSSDNAHDHVWWDRKRKSRRRRKKERKKEREHQGAYEKRSDVTATFFSTKINFFPSSLSLSPALTSEPEYDEHLQGGSPMKIRKEERIWNLREEDDDEARGETSNTSGDQRSSSRVLLERRPSPYWWFVVDLTAHVTRRIFGRMIRWYSAWICGLIFDETFDDQWRSRENSFSPDWIHLFATIVDEQQQTSSWPIDLLDEVFGAAI